MATHTEPDTPEPFGQRGILPYVWPTFVVLCAIGVCTCLIMHRRSSYTWDSVSNTAATRRVIVASVIGRLVVDIFPVTEGDVTSSNWNFDSRDFATIQDGWPESWKKTLGIQWGDESIRRFGGQQLDYWRFRIRWRTLAILYALPVGIELLRQVRRRTSRHDARQRLLPGSSPD